MGPCVLAGAYDFGFWVELCDPVCKSFYQGFCFVFGALSYICWVSDLHWGLALSLLNVAFGHIFFNRTLGGALCSGWGV